MLHWIGIHPNLRCDVITPTCNVVLHIYTMQPAMWFHESKRKLYMCPAQKKVYTCKEHIYTCGRSEWFEGTYQFKQLSLRCNCNCVSHQGLPVPSSNVSFFSNHAQPCHLGVFLPNPSISSRTKRGWMMFGWCTSPDSGATVVFRQRWRDGAILRLPFCCIHLYWFRC
jgi:hypothetical protein